MKTHEYDGFPEGIVERWKHLESAGLGAAGFVNGVPQLFEGIFDDPILFPLQRKAEMQAMLQTAFEIAKPAVVMEIGSDKGGSFYHWLKCLPGVKKGIAVEYRGTPFEDSFSRMFPNIELCCLKGSSHAPDLVNRVEFFLRGEKIDALFIDGDKNGTARDFAAYLPMMRPGGVVMIHDIDEDIPPRQFFWSLRGRYRLTAIHDGVEGLRFQKAGAPPKTAWEDWLRIWGARSCGVGVIHV